MRKLLCAIGMLAGFTVGTLAASATTLTFDDLTAGGNPLPSSYQGFAWSNFYANVPATERPSGYVNGTVSPSTVIYNGFGAGASFTSSSNSTFTLNDFYLTAGVNNGLEVDVIGSANGITLYTASFDVSTSAPTRELLDWTGIDTVSFASSGGTLDPIAGLNYVAGTQFVLDNVRVNEALTPVTSTPEPGTLALLATGLVGVTALRRRSRV